MIRSVTITASRCLFIHSSSTQHHAILPDPGSLGLSVDMFARPGIFGHLLGPRYRPSSVDRLHVDWSLCFSFLASPPISPRIYITRNQQHVLIHPSQFPYAIDVLPETADAKWEDAEFQGYVKSFPGLAQKSAKTFSSYAINLMKQDSKVPYLKKLQGYLWKNGWESGAFVAPLYADVVPELRAWHGSGKQIVIFSSGSVDAQKLLFGHAEDDQDARTAPESAEKKRKTDSDGPVNNANEAEPAAKKVKTREPEDNDAKAEVPDVKTPAVASQDLNPLITDYFDTQNAGPKQEKGSYEKIAKALGKECSEILFLSDNVKEVKAALEAGMKSFVIDRPGNEPLSEDDRKTLTVYTSFKDIPLL
ncbi:HAD-like domain-containing protein [Phyllosticta citriasiana]|uniref:HAD-like domain-containing protein n=1 Tax=Phyllosticta citriasiana TaxID=595635 RepID=A0ABR1KHI2_9PEZI